MGRIVTKRTSIEMIPPGKRLFVPFTVSTGKNGKANARGTRVFVPQGTKPSKELVDWMKDVRKKYVRASKEPGVPGIINHGIRVDHVAYKLDMERGKIADKSDFFMRPVGKRILAVRNALIRAGIHIETPTVQLGRNLELFERGGFTRISKRDITLDELKKKTIWVAVRMHDANVAHNHLNTGNFVMDASGRFKLIDLSLAKLYKKPARNEKEFITRFAEDIFTQAREFAHMERDYPRREDNGQLHEAIIRNIKEILEAHKLPYAVSPTELHKYALMY